jgi:hypothetical protein
MIPLINTYRSEEKNYAVELTAEEIFSSVENIKEISKSPRKDICRIDPEELPGLFVEVKEKSALVVNESRMFLQIVFGEKPQGVIELRLLADNQKPFSLFAPNLDNAISIAQSYSGSTNVYFGVAARIDKSSGKKINCKELNVIYVDIDFGMQGHKGKTQYSTQEEALITLNGCDLKPTAIIFSGHGFQVYWKLKESYILGGECNKKIEDLMRHLNQQLGGDPTQNVDRLFRMPHTLNIKSEPFIESAIVEMDSTRIYSFEELEKWVDQLTSKQAADNNNIGDKNVGDTDALLPISKYEKVKENCQCLLRMYKKAYEEHHLSHTERFFLANLLLQFEGGRQEIHKILRSCSDYNEEYTDSQIKSLVGKPPLCAGICPEKCEALKRTGKNSPIAFAYLKETGQNSENPLSLKIIEMDGVYKKEVKIKNRTEYIPLTSFIIHPKELLDLGDSDCLTCKVTTAAGLEYDNIQIANADWHSRVKLLKAIGHQDCVILGSDIDVQALCYYVNLQVIVKKKGTRVIGLHDHVWVIKDLNITKDEISKEQYIVPFFKGGDSYINKIEYKILDHSETKSMVQDFNKTIPFINDMNPIMVWIGWLFATPLKPRLTELADGFPILFVHGVQGSGKSSTARELMRLSGYNDHQINVCTQKPFPMLKLLSSTNAIPIYFDEYKKNDMRAEQVENLLRYMRTAYADEVESKGRADQTTVDYSISAPMAVMGEWSITQPAIKERVLMVRFNDTVKINEAYQEQFKKLKSLPLEGFMPEYLKFILSVNILAIFNDSVRFIDVHFKGVHVAPRVKNNLAIMVTGINLFETYGKLNDCELPELNISNLLDDQLSEITGTKTGQVKSSVDQLLEGISIMMSGKREQLSISGKGADCLEGSYFKTITTNNKEGEKTKHLAIQFRVLFPDFKEWARRTNYEGDLLDCDSYMRLFDDCTYITAKNRSVKFWVDKTVRCVCVDIAKAEKAGLNLEGFLNCVEEKDEK